MGAVSGILDFSRNLFSPGTPAMAASPSPPSIPTDAKSDTSRFLDVEIIAGTLIGEAENLGIQGMTEVACVIQTRKWMGGWWGNTLRGVCLCHEQFSIWNDTPDNHDRARVIEIMEHDPLYAPYTDATVIAHDLQSPNGILDVTNGATHYFNSATMKPPAWSVGRTPCHTNGAILFYRLGAS